MKKLFTSLLLLSVALCSWGQSGYSFTGGVLTVPYDANMPNDPEGIKNYIVSQIDDLNAFPASITTLKLIGSFTNGDFAKDAKVHKLVDACSKPNAPINLDLSACSDLVSKVEYTSTETNPVKNPKYVFSTETERKDLIKKRVWYFKDDNTQVTYDFDNLTPDANNEASWSGYHNNGNGPHTVYCKDVYGYLTDPYNQNSFVEVDPSLVKGDETNGYYAEVAKEGTAFAFAKEYGTRLKGITFPNGSNFTAIPDNLCNTVICPNLETVVWGNNLKWIGENAFRGGVNNNNQYSSASKLKKIGIMSADGTVTFPTITLKGTELNEGVVKFPNTLEVIGKDAFYECTAFRYVNLDLENLVKVDAAAFNMYRDDLNHLDYVQMPSKVNQSLKFWGNQVFASSHIETLDFRYCEGIKHFAYDGKNSMGEGTFNPVTEEGANNNKGVGSNTFFWHQYLTTLILPPNLEYVAGGESANSGMAVECVRLETIEFTGRAQYDDNCNLTNGLVIPMYAFAFAQADETVNVNVVTNGEGIGTSTLRKLKNVILSDNITYITQYAFNRTSLETIHIPASVQTIEAKAFEACRALKVVVFDDVASDCQECKDKIPATTVKSQGDGSGAFNNCAGVTDVYVNRPEKLKCENYGFDAATTYGRGNAMAGFATLHFPEKYMDNYVNTSHKITNDIVTDPGLFHKWLMKHMDLAVNHPPKNGWWEFINAGPMKTNIDEEPTYQDIMLRTFSDKNNAYLVPDGLRAYIVNDIQKAKDINNQETGNYELTLQRIYIIPAKTGVILYGHPNGHNVNGDPILSMTPAFFANENEEVAIQGDILVGGENEGRALCRDNWSTDNKTYNNYLEPTSTGNGIDLKPYVKDEATGKVIWRNFIMSRFNTTLSPDADPDSDDAGYMGFFRVVAGHYPDGYAYLKLKYDEYENTSGNEILVKQDPQYYYERNIKSGQLYNARNCEAKLNPRGWWDESKDFRWEEQTKSWGVRQFAGNKVLVNLAELEDADGIVKLTIPADDITGGDYYTLQGVKVTNPTKGVYIRNGKKVILK